MYIFNLTSGADRARKMGRNLLRTDAQIEYDRLVLLEGDPDEIPTPAEISSLQNGLKRAVPGENRDRAYLELLYYCGLSAPIISNLHLDDVNLADRTLTLRSTEEESTVLPLGENTVRILRDYLNEARQALAGDSSCDNFFVTPSGEIYSPRSFQSNWYKYLARMNLARFERVHCLRGGFLVCILSGSFSFQDFRLDDYGDLLDLIETNHQ